LREELIKNNQGLTGDWQAHHLIPNQVWNNNTTKKFFNAIGFTGQHSASNGLAMPSTAQSANINNRSIIHSGNHSNYNTNVQGAVDRIQHRYQRVLANGVSQDQAAATARNRLGRLQESQRRNLSRNDRCTPINLRDLAL